MLRVAIAVAATLELVYFYIELPYSFGKMLDPRAQWFNILTGSCMAVLAPLIALAALGLAAAGRRFGVAGVLLVVAPVVYWAPMIAFMIGIAIHGF